MAAEPKDASRASDKRLVELDALRGVAAVAVVLFHFTTNYQERFGHTGELAFSVPWGHFGVELFFILSGFVILMSLERSGGAARFAWGRITRLYPTYWVALALAFTVVNGFGEPWGGSPRDALLNTTMAPTLFGGQYIDAAYWSLEAELIFYANMLVLHAVGAFKRPATTVVCWLLAALACHGAIRWAAFGSPVAFDWLRMIRTLLSLQYIGLFGIGLLLRARLGWGVRSIGLSLCLLTLGVLEGFDVLPIYLALTGLFAAAAYGRTPWLRSKPLLWLGALSYPLYLIHQNIGYLTIMRLEAAGASPLTAVAAATLLSLLLASWLHRGVEAPSLAALRKIDPLRSLGRPTTEPGLSARAR